jgi:hypothetical protein
MESYCAKAGAQILLLQHTADLFLKYEPLSSADENQILDCQWLC